jgi:hypothetical protein
MLKFRVRLTRDLKFVTLELLERRRLARGTWRRVEEESNSALGCEEGTWENWVFESPGGVKNIRLYDPADVRSALLKDYLTGRTGGEGVIFIPEFAGSFGSDAFQWNQIPHSLVNEWSAVSRMTGRLPSPDPAPDHHSRRAS